MYLEILPASKYFLAPEEMEITGYSLDIRLAHEINTISSMLYFLFQILDHNDEIPNATTPDGNTEQFGKTSSAKPSRDVSSGTSSNKVPKRKKKENRYLLY